MKLHHLSIYILAIICHDMSEIICVMLRLWTFIWVCVGVYGARPNVICYIFGKGVVELLASTFSNGCKYWYLYVVLVLPVQMTVEYVVQS